MLHPPQLGTALWWNSPKVGLEHKSSEYNWTAMFFNLSLSCIHIPSSVFGASTLFLLLRISVKVWKYVVFLSPNLIQSTLDFWSQIISSWISIRVNSFFSLSSSFNKLVEVPLSSACCTPLRRRQSLFFLLNMLPKVSMFHATCFFKKSPKSSSSHHSTPTLPPSTWRNYGEASRQLEI